MRKMAGSALVALLTLASCSGMTVLIDYDKNADFDSYQTFAWADTSEMSVADSSPLMHQRIVDAVQAKLVTDGLRKVTSNPDLYVTYHTDERQEMRLNTTHFGYGYGGGWYRHPHWGGSMGSSTTTVRVPSVRVRVSHVISRPFDSPSAACTRASTPTPAAGRSPFSAAPRYS